MPTGFAAAAERLNVAADGSEASQPATGNWNSLSDDGRFAVFSSAAANLVAGDSNGVADVFVRDRQTGITSRVSVASNGSEANGPSGAAVISGDGRYVAFESQAGNLVAGDSNGVSDVFVHDRQTGQTWRVSVAGDGSQGNGPSLRPDLSADGRFVSFESQATNLVPGAPYWGGIYVHDRQTTQTTLESVNSAGVAAAFAYVATLSDDGRYVAFTAGNFNEWGFPGLTAINNVYVRDRNAGTTWLAGRAADGTPANADNGPGTLSGDGRFVAFISVADNLVPGDSNGLSDVFVHDRVVLYGSAADNLVAGDGNGLTDVFVQAMAGADSMPPEITLTSLDLTKQAAYTLSGVLSETATLSVDGQMVSVAPDLSFQHALTLSEGANELHLLATDGAGNSTVLDFTVTLDSTPPAAPDPGLIQISPPDAAGQVSISGGAGSVEGNATVMVTNLRTGETVTVSADATGAFTATLGGQSGDSYRVVVEDAAGNQSAATAGVGLPPDPAAIAPPVDLTVASDLYAATAFLYTGLNAVQTGVAAGTIEPRRVAVIRGGVLGRDNAPLPGVTLTVKDHPEYGHTLSRADGRFDLAVNGGGLLVLNYEKPGYLPVQRKVNTPWRDYARAEDVVMISLDGTVTSISAGSPDMQVARGGMVADSGGSRQATLLFPPGTTAEMVLTDGARQPLSQLNVRATEYTVGDNGPQAMPGELPPASGSPTRWNCPRTRLLRLGRGRSSSIRRCSFTSKTPGTSPSVRKCPPVGMMPTERPGRPRMMAG